MCDEKMFIKDIDLNYAPDSAKIEINYVVGRLKKMCIANT